jgi:glutamate-1-semialdehyde 2,1-aminomutase
MIIGHAHPEIINAVMNQSKKGTSYGIPTELETKMAESIGFFSS